MISIVKNEAQTGVKRYVCDKKDELSSIDLRTTQMGSTCYVIYEQKTYILDGEYNWVLLKNTSSSGGDSEDDEYIADGGEVEDNNSSSDEENTYIADGGEII